MTAIEQVKRDLSKGHAIYCEAGTGKPPPGGPWWMVDSLDHDTMTRMYQVKPEHAIQLIQGKHMESIDAKPPVKSWRRGVPIRAWPGYVKTNET